MLMRLLGLLLIACASVSADFQQIQIKWTSGLCGPDCVKNLQREFSKIPGFKQASFGNSQVTLLWQEGAPFTFASINTATRMVGIRLWEVRIRVKGKVSHNKDIFVLTSDGDGTPVQLLGPTMPSATGNTVVPNVQTHGLNSALQNKLLDAEASKASIVVEGPLFQPFQMPDLRVIVTSIRGSTQAAPAPTTTKPTPVKGKPVTPPAGGAHGS